MIVTFKVVVFVNIREQFHAIVLSLGRIHRDVRQMVKGGSSQLSVKQLQQRVGVKPSLADCVDGLMLLQDMHCSEYVILFYVFYLCIDILVENIF